MSRDLVFISGRPRNEFTNALNFDIFGIMEIMVAVSALSALAQESRLEVFRLLVRAGNNGVPAGKIGAQLELPLSTLSFHLNQLKYAGLVKCRREGRTLFYSANYSAMNTLMAYLTENCCQGEENDCSVPVECVPKAKTKPKKKKR